MKFPIDEHEFTETWVSGLTDPEDEDKELGTAIARAINRAYVAGVEEGKKTK